jgi:hypothetical protein
VPDDAYTTLRPNHTTTITAPIAHDRLLEKNKTIGFKPNSTKMLPFQERREK